MSQQRRQDSWRLESAELLMSKELGRETTSRAYLLTLWQGKAYNQAVVNQANIRNGFEVLLEYGRFKYGSALKVAADASVKFKIFVSDALDDGRLLQGRAYPRAWIGFATMARMVRAYLAFAIDNGSLSWDVTVLNCLAVTMQAALGCRAGELALSRGYDVKEGVYAKFKDVVLQLAVPDDDGDDDEARPPLLQDIRATVDLHYLKGKKKLTNTSTRRHLTPLADADVWHACPIRWLIIHALRHGLVAGGPTVAGVLNEASRRQDRQIRWLRPELPILANQTGGTSHLLILEKPMIVKSVNRIVKEMGVAAGVLGRVHSHALRAGTARDLAVLPPTALARGLNVELSRQGLAHAYTALGLSTTEEYIGDNNEDLYTARAGNRFEPHLNEPDFAAPTTPAATTTAPPPRQGVENPSFWMPDQGEPNGTRPRSLLKRKKALAGTTSTEARLTRSGGGKKRKKNAAAVADSPAAPEPSTKRQKRTPLAELSTNVATNLPTTLDQVNVPPVEQSVTDPRLLALDDMEEADGAEAMREVEQLQATIFFQADDRDDPGQPQTETTSTAEEEANATAMILQSSEAPPDPPGIAIAGASTAEQWCQGYAEVNVVINRFEKRKLQPRAAGSSKSEATAFLYHCKATPECPFSSKIAYETLDHERTCTPQKAQGALEMEAAAAAMARGDRVEGATYCPEPDCGWWTLNDNPKTSLSKHKTAKHTEWTPKKCPDPLCESDEVFNTRISYNAHTVACRNKADGYPTTCRYPNCKRTADGKTIKNAAGMTDHLKTHGLLDSKARAPHMPPPPQRFQKQACFLPDCAADIVFSVASDLVTHLIEYHELDEDTADARVQTEGQWIARKIQTLTSSKGKSRQTSESVRRRTK